MNTHIENLINQFFTNLDVIDVYARPKYISTIKDIPISRVTYSGNKTIVFFIDGSKCVVTCSPNDKYDRQTAITYALVKRLFGKVDQSTGLVDGAGIGMKLEKIANAGFDQEKEAKELKSKKAQAKAAHEAKQKQEQKLAFERKARKLAEELKLKQRAQEILEHDSLTKTKKVLNESNATYDDNSSSNKKTSNRSWQDYVKPDKPFSKFTSEEKREYWKYHNAKRRYNK